uniref:Putative tick defensins 1 n=1 Tax=Amblyomma cajennense TaxID=34607 RepID=A0A023FQN5_AMBCJ
MKVLAVALLIVLVAGLVSTVPVQDDESGVAQVRVRRDYGCFGLPSICKKHCKDIGRKGGKCTGFLDHTCTCD